MPVACKQVAINAKEVACKVWPHLEFKGPIFECDFPQRYVLLLDVEHDRSDQKGFAIVPDEVQRAPSTALDWEPLFLKDFPMFGRTMLHAMAYPEEDSEQWE